MKNAFVILLLTAAGLAAQASASTAPASAKTAKKITSPSKTTAPERLTIPADATRNADATFSWTDKQGKKWSYANTPFGVIRSEVGAELKGVKVFDQGDTVRFERPGPFGTIRVEKKKTELTDEERALVTKQAASQNAKQE